MKNQWNVDLNVVLNNKESLINDLTVLIELKLIKLDSAIEVDYSFLAKKYGLSIGTTSLLFVLIMMSVEYATKFGSVRTGVSVAINTISKLNKKHFRVLVPIWHGVILN